MSLTCTPYHSNDNAHVEQKNLSCVRQLFGYERFGNPRLVNLMNDLYANEFSLFTNFFQPTQKLASKARDGSKWVGNFYLEATRPDYFGGSATTVTQASQRAAIENAACCPK